MNALIDSTLAIYIQVLNATLNLLLNSIYKYYYSPTI